MHRAGKHRDETTLDTLHSLDDLDEDHDLAAQQSFVEVTSEAVN
jgi:hypothetical protein